jgi:RNA-directed DNA polymerase
VMNGPGKSDRTTVPEKSPNNAGKPAAEGMEGRDLAKGNRLGQNASRTPSRSDASSALERVRQAAKKDRKTRFTALLHHIYNLETLRMAYCEPNYAENVKRKMSGRPFLSNCKNKSPGALRCFCSF